MTIDSIHAIAALCVGIVLIALPWLLPRDSGEYVRCTQCLKYHQACSHICPACLTPDSTASSAPQYAYILTTRTRGMHIQLLLAVGEFLICVAQCALPCLIIKNIIVNAGRQWRIGTHAGRWHASACIWHRDCLLRCYIRGLLLRGTLYVRHISTYATWRLCHRPDERRY